MSGLKVQKIDSITLLQFRFQNVGELLSSVTPVAFRNYGPGQLSTASFRGTSANHTAVLWNGLNINSPILGQSDFSTLPVAGFDQLSVQYGSAASIVGTDAVGGSILLGSVAPAEGLFAYKAEQFDSFRNYQSQAGARYGTALNTKWVFSGKTSLYYSGLTNHYPYRERKGYAVLPTETFQKGLVQDLFFTSKNNQELSAHMWLTKNSLTLTPDNLAGRELTRTEAYRTMIRYQVRDLTFRSSWVRDIIDYAKGDYTALDHAVTDRLSNRIEKDFELNIKNSDLTVQVKTGGEWTYYRARVGGYEKPFVTENRADLFMLTRMQLTPAWLLSATIRQAFVTRFNPPFTPSLGSDYDLIQTGRYLLKAKASFSRSYRVPTLNERYWADLGNPDIRPEHGWNKELGLEQRFTRTNSQIFTSSITAYHNRVKDWTYWNPVQNYHVENLQQVLAKGIELQTGWRSDYGILKTGFNLGYAYNHSAQERLYDAYAADVMGKQLVFVPLHSGNLNAFLQYKNTRLTASVQTNSKRYTTFDNSQHLNGYTIADLLAETTFQWNRISMRVQGQVNNLSNTFYLNVRNNAMPGRNFAINLIAMYHHSSQKNSTLNKAQ